MQKQFTSAIAGFVIVLVAAAPVGLASDDSKSESAGDGLPTEVSQMAQVGQAQRIVAALGSVEDPLAAAVNVAKLGNPSSSGADAAGLWPSQAASELLEAFGVVPTTDQFWSIVTLDLQPTPVRDALANLMSAQLDLQILTELAAVDGFSAGAPSMEGLLAGRGSLLDVVVELDQALSGVGLASTSTSMSSGNAPPVQVPGVFSIDLEKDVVTGDPNCGPTVADDVYTADFALLVDRCGDDTYLNNAGGSNLNGGSCNIPATPTAAVLVDLRGNDNYTSGRSCGANGGGFIGVGILLDKGGNDTYAAGDSGTNGGGDRGVGLLINLPGEASVQVSVEVKVFPHVRVTVTSNVSTNLASNDEYHAGGHGTNGGAFQGLGSLIDVGGDDLYNATSRGVNGGGFTAGTGLLVDAGGSDNYVAQGVASNGGAAEFRAVGLLLDLDGNDNYLGGNFAVNGAGFGGSGALIDLAGSDTYTGINGANGEVRSQLFGGDATGLLLDARGADTYNDGTARGSGTDVTVLFKGGFGFQVDLPLP